MINAWSLLYDAMESLEPEEKIWKDLDDRYEKYLQEMNSYDLNIQPAKDYAIKPTKKPPSNWKYGEDKTIKEIEEYISRTYNAHYSSKIQTLDLIESVGDAEAFCRSNILKYASRYDKKGTARMDIMKIIHYAILLYHFSLENSETSTPYETF